MTQDLHSHTYFSACGADDPELLILKAIESGIDVFGISDHNYGIGDKKRRYFSLLTELQQKYSGKIRLFRGIEIATVNGLCLAPEEDISYFDYCLVEHIDRPDSCVGGENIISFSKRCGCPTGIAHTDLFSYLERKGSDPDAYFAGLAENGIFWEMNVNYDSVHGYREHPYVQTFLNSREQQKLVKNAGVCLSVGFDSHRRGEYRKERVKQMCDFLDNLGIPLFIPEKDIVFKK